MEETGQNVGELQMARMIAGNTLCGWYYHVLSDEETEGTKTTVQTTAHTITNSNEVVAEFIAFHEQLLEKKSKLAFFDIAEDKLLRLDGYTAAFYKAAWLVIGGEITQAIIDLFTNGWLLKQMIEQETAFRYHWRCAQLSLFQLEFAYDLLLFCEARDPSIVVFQRGLELFAALSGLHVNPAKSQLILSKARHDSARLLATLDFQEGHLPIKYLGLPLISSHLSLANCRPLLDKIDRYIQGWGGISQSFAARVHLIKSVLMALNTYWAMAFTLPKGIIKEIEKCLENFLWKGVAGTGYLKVAWPQVCNPVDEGGLRVRDIQSLNLALMSRWL
ncbi:UNVERIFIED_CONTAM: hypothetical protein Scaly_2791800 [Sesamum calycinum]|uniref:Uncharacterized protein n=1 Tax=Sesamum calycinum TaxID=2727403 RepID=A0AAW2IWB1_9LAMI